MNNKLLNEYLGKKSSKKDTFITRLLISIMIVLLSLIYVKGNDNNLEYFRKYVFEDTFNFYSFNDLYNSLSGNKKDIVPVSSSVKYTKIGNYLDGVSLKVNDNLVETFTSGIVVYIGSKDGYNNTVIIQGSDGYDIWYGNIDDINVSLYDYINKNTIIGQSDKLYIQVLKDGKNIKEDEYLHI